jgi:hypothetical protein
MTDLAPPNLLRSNFVLSTRTRLQSILPAAADRKGKRSVDRMAASAGLRGNHMLEMCVGSVRTRKRASWSSRSCRQKNKQRYGTLQRNE